jgi:hypothetical protein
VPYEVIHLGGATAAIVPLHELRVLQALKWAASPEALEEAEDLAALSASRERQAAGTAVWLPMDEVRARLGLTRR